MFVRVKSSPNSPRQSVQIVENVRVGDKVKQRIVRYVGIALNDFELEKLKDVAAYIIANLQQEQQQLCLFDERSLGEAIIAARKRKQDDSPLPVNLRELREEARTTVGLHEVYGQVFDDLGFASLFGVRKQASAALLRDVVMARIAQPVSKLATSKLLKHSFGKEFDVERIYRMMDHLDDSFIAKLQKLTHQHTKQLLGGKVDVCFYDCTTLYFESFDEDELRQKGFSKDHKSQETQVLLALLVTREGLPIGYRLYPGASWEGHTLRHAIKSIEDEVDVGKVTLVADAAMFSRENLEILKDKSFVVAARIKNLPHSLVKQILNRDGYQRFADQDGYYWEGEYQGYRLVVTYSPKRAAKDANDRHKAIQKIIKRYHNRPVKQLARNGYGRYLKLEGEGRLLIDEEKIKKAEAWDGLHGVIANTDLPVEEIREQYRGLWQVEDTFRLSKHDLRMRPMFHWVERRIRAHVAICFMALSCMRHMMYHCAKRYRRLSAEVIRRDLMAVQVSTLRDQKTNKRYGMPSKAGEHTRKLYSLVGKKLSVTPFAFDRE